MCCCHCSVYLDSAVPLCVHLSSNTVVVTSLHCMFPYLCVTQMPHGHVFDCMEQTHHKWLEPVSHLCNVFPEVKLASSSLRGCADFLTCRDHWEAAPVLVPTLDLAARLTVLTSRSWSDDLICGMLLSQMKYSTINIIIDLFLKMLVGPSEIQVPSHMGSHHMSFLQ